MTEAAACSGCGRVLPGGTEGCQALFQAVGARAVRDLAYARTRLLTVDTYCLQHPDRYCRSAKSLAAHLAGLCWSLEFAATGPGALAGAAISTALSRRPSSSPRYRRTAERSPSPTCTPRPTPRRTRV
ncbi:MAG: DUF5946 family protein [Chloroflexota bacterium]